MNVERHRVPTAFGFGFKVPLFLRDDGDTQLFAGLIAVKSGFGLGFLFGVVVTAAIF